jgi:hypothetical protein
MWTSWRTGIGALVLVCILYLPKISFRHSNKFTKLLQVAVSA